MAVVQGEYVAEDFIMKVAFVAIYIVVWVDINPLCDDPATTPTQPSSSKYLIFILVYYDVSSTMTSKSYLLCHIFASLTQNQRGLDHHIARAVGLKSRATTLSRLAPG